MIKYKTKEWRGEPGARILKIECERETDKCVWIDNTRRLKITEDERFFDTWKEAHEYILELANNQVNQAIFRLEMNGLLLLNIYRLKEDN